MIIVCAIDERGYYKECYAIDPKTYATLDSETLIQTPPPDTRKLPAKWNGTEWVYEGSYTPTPIIPDGTRTLSERLLEIESDIVTLKEQIKGTT